MSLSPYELETEFPDHYRFRYTLFRVEVEIKEDLCIAKMGIKTEVIPLKKIVYFFHHKPLNQDQRELVIAYRGAKEGTLKRARLFADVGEDDFDEFIERIRWEAPDGDLSHLSDSEAYRLMGSRELAWVTLPGIMMLGILFFALGGSPLLIHGLDQGETLLETAHLYQLYNAGDEGAQRAESYIEKLTSHTVRLEGTLDLDRSWSKIEARGGSPMHTLFTPLYPLSWSPQQRAQTPAILILSVRMTSKVDPQHLGQQTSFKGILRNIGWESLSDTAKRGLIAAQVPLISSPLLIDVDAHPKSDLILFSLVVGFLMFITAIVFLYLRPSSL